MKLSLVARHGIQQQTEAHHHDSATLRMIHGTPVQFIASPNQLADEAIEQAVERQLDGVVFRVMRPEHLAALWLQASGAKRRERVEILRQAGAVDEKLLADLLERYGVGG